MSAPVCSIGSSLATLALHAAHPLTRSELNSHAAIDHAPIKGRPRVDGPSSIDRLVSAQDRIPSGLKHTGQVLTVDEESQRSDAPFGQHSNNDVRLPDIAIWVGFESLAACRCSRGASS